MIHQPVPGPSAIAALGGKFRDLPGQPGYVTVSGYHEQLRVDQLMVFAANPDQRSLGVRRTIQARRQDGEEGWVRRCRTYGPALLLQAVLVLSDSLQCTPRTATSFISSWTTAYMPMLCTIDEKPS